MGNDNYKLRSSRLDQRKDNIWENLGKEKSSDENAYVDGYFGE